MTPLEFYSPAQATADRYGQFENSIKLYYMKKIIIIVFSIIAIRTYGQIQTVGFQFGLNLSNITAREHFEDTKYRKAISTGIKYEFLFSNKFSLGLDVLYSQQGFNEDISYTIADEFGEIITVKPDEKTKYKYDYLLVPLKVGYSFGNTLKISPKFGLCPAILLDAKMILPAVNENGIKIDEQTFEHKNVNKFDVSGQLEIEVKYPINKMELFTSALYRQSLTKFSNDNYFKESKMMHLGFSFSIGLTYRIN